MQALLEARRSGRQIAPPFALRDRAMVYAIQDGVARAIDILAKEIRTTMQLIGATSVADLSPALVRLREAR